ncbi:hypothetical protein SAMN05216175_10276 [Neptunomonas qingdaonensis]|uniref:Uncharacterized protein n=1 Tax=Neptunomonas qingdaonensis TaxID=1045558 RepID=A0A1I2MVH9_9GAMM|nr:hypothetical protein SAMN05216175_10276 [Neptunomonas qingdaonensis]
MQKQPLRRLSIGDCRTEIMCLSSPLPLITLENSVSNLKLIFILMIHTHPEGVTRTKTSTACSVNIYSKRIHYRGISDEQVKQLQTRLNIRHRKCLGCSCHRRFCINPVRPHRRVLRLCFEFTHHYSLFKFASSVQTCIILLTLLSRWRQGKANSTP